MDTQTKRSLFITGATGYIGLAVIRSAIPQGFSVRGLSRTPEGDSKLTALGATPVRGDLSSLDVLSDEAANADAVIHLAFIHDFTLDYDVVLRTEGNAIAAMAKSLKGTGKPLVYSGVTTLVQPDPQAHETDEDAPIVEKPLLRRMEAEASALAWAKEGVKISVLRLPPYVWGRGGSTFLPVLIGQAIKLGESICVNDWNHQTCAVHVDDAAKLYLLMVEKARAGEVINGTSETDVSVRGMTEAVAAVAGAAVRNVDKDEAERVWGKFLVEFVGIANRAGSQRARERFGWKPKILGMLEDVKSGSYVETAKRLRDGNA